VGLSCDDVRAGIREHATPGPGASGRWLATCPEDHLLAVKYAIGFPNEPGCTDAAVLFVFDLLAAERGNAPVRAGDLHVAIGKVEMAVGVEWGRRQGWLTVEPPLPSIFEPGDSIVKPTDKMPPPRES
jgi:hypothetical protein